MKPTHTSKFSFSPHALCNVSNQVGKMDLNLQFGIDSSAFALPTLPLDSVDDIFYGVTASPEHDERIEQYVLLNIPKDVQF